MTVKKAPYEFLTSSEDRLSGINLNWLTLVFEGENAYLEQDYLDNHAIGVLQIQRVGVLVGALMMATLGVMDFLVLEEALDTILAVRYGVLVPATLIFLVYTCSRHFSRHAQGAVTCMVTFMGFGLSAIILIAPVDTSPLYFAGNMLAIFFAYTFLGLRFVLANLVGWSIFIGVVGADYLLGKTGFEDQFMGTNLTLSAFFLGMVVTYSSEFLSRRDFCLRNALELRRVELEGNRSNLEARVHERTGQALAAAKAKTDFLANMSHEIRTPMNGQEAIGKFGLESYDLIFMDCQMPGMDGFETTVAIRAQEQEKGLSKTVIVALTANAMEGDKKGCLDSGMDDYMSNSISLAGLTQVLNRGGF